MLGRVGDSPPCEKPAACVSRKNLTRKGSQQSGNSASPSAVFDQDFPCFGSTSRGSVFLAPNRQGCCSTIRILPLPCLRFSSIFCAYVDSRRQYPFHLIERSGSRSGIRSRRSRVEPGETIPGNTRSRTGISSAAKYYVSTCSPTLRARVCMWDIRRLHGHDILARYRGNGYMVHRWAGTRSDCRGTVCDRDGNIPRYHREEYRDFQKAIKALGSVTTGHAKWTPRIRNISVDAVIFSSFITPGSIPPPTRGANSVVGLSRRTHE